ncbi:MAG TPA: MBL fold metallo-hydrolase [Clostridia bacterium]|nr:MBL fold metallo-hydrolase [Clostridia bacterium]
MYRGQEVSHWALHRRLSQGLSERVRQDLALLRDVPTKPPADGDWIYFLGTGGNPINLITQYRQTGGFILKVGQAVIYVDPGPGAIVHAARAGLDLSMLEAVYVSHGHTDHCGEAGVVIEAMCRLMSARRGIVIAPGRVLDAGLISPFHQGKEPSRAYKGGPAEVVRASAGEPITVRDVDVFPIMAYHGDENYGFVLRTKSGDGLSVGYTSDTSYIISYMGDDGERQVEPWDAMTDYKGIVRYHEDLKAAFCDVDVLIANVSYHSLFANRCLTGVGLAHMLSGSKVRLCIMTHMDVSCFKPEDVSSEMARYVTDASGVNVIVAEDNKRYDLHEAIKDRGFRRQTMGTL